MFSDSYSLMLTVAHTFALFNCHWTIRRRPRQFLSLWGDTQPFARHGVLLG